MQSPASIEAHQVSLPSVLPGGLTTALRASVTTDVRSVAGLKAISTMDASVLATTGLWLNLREAPEGD